MLSFSFLVVFDALMTWTHNTNMLDSVTSDSVVSCGNYKECGISKFRKKTNINGSDEILLLVNSFGGGTSSFLGFGFWSTVRRFSYLLYSLYSLKSILFLPVATKKNEKIEELNSIGHNNPHPHPNRHHRPHNNPI